MPAAKPVIVSPEVTDPFAGGVTGFELKEQVPGQFVTESVTALLYPAVDVTVIVELAGLPWVIVTEDGLAEIEKSGAVIVNETDVVCVPALPETVSGKVPGDAPPTAIVRVDMVEPFAAGVTDDGFSTHVADAGQPLTVRSTALLNPFREVTVIVEGAALP